MSADFPPCPRPDLKTLVELARKAQRHAREAQAAQAEWVDAFRHRYGHDDIADELVELIDYGRGTARDITEEFIEAHSHRDGS